MSSPWRAYTLAQTTWLPWQLFLLLGLTPWFSKFIPTYDINSSRAGLMQQMKASMISKKCSWKAQHLPSSTLKCQHSSQQMPQIIHCVLFWCSCTLTTWNIVLTSLPTSCLLPKGSTPQLKKRLLLLCGQLKDGEHMYGDVDLHLELITKPSLLY